MNRTSPQVCIMPSLLAGDFGRLAASARKAEAAGGDALHLDIMDGCFVPNISFGPAVVQMARRAVRIPLNVHLMLLRPDRYLTQFIEAGADTLLIHVESAVNIARTLRRIRALGAAPGIVLNPETPYTAILPYLAEVDQILCMTVHPGFGGQKFIRRVLSKISDLRKYCRAAQKAMDIAVDGGIDLQTVGLAAAAGANLIVAGQALYRARDMAGAVRRMRQKAEKALE